MATLKFGFKKTISSKPLRTNIKSKFGDPDDLTQVEQKDYVHSIDGTQINGSFKKPAAESKELIIPMIHQNHWRKEKDKRRNDSNGVTSNGTSRIKSNDEHLLESQAVNEILESAKLANEQRGTEPDIGAIPLLLQNRIPDGFETDDKLDVSLRAEESSLDDYERIPIEQFGLAMLRGMGWSKSEGIGLSNKKVVDTVEPQIRPRGLGLGAERPNV